MSVRQRWLVVAVVGAVVAVVFGGALTVAGLVHRSTTTPATASEATVEISTARAFGTPFESDCSGSAELDCWVADDVGAGGSPYRVVVDEAGCWVAELDGPQGGEVPMPDRASGCVTRYDHFVARYPWLLAVPM